MLREGDQSQQPHRGDICKINVIGKLENGTVVEELHDYTLQVGDVEVVQGIDMVLPLMRVGELAQVAAEARFAYGSIGLKNDTDNDKSIPPNATVSFDWKNEMKRQTELNCSIPSLVFQITYEVELLECKEEDDLENLPYKTRQNIG